MEESAETEGFEPSIPFRGIHTFQACSFNHSDKSPFKGGKNTITYVRRNRVAAFCVVMAATSSAVYPVSSANLAVMRGK